MAKHKLNLLVAYPYFTPQVKQLFKTIDPDSYRLIVDSGAFTAYNAGKEVKLDEYCGFLDDLKEAGLEYEAIQLDVMYDPVGTKKNLDIMRERGYKVHPVFTRGEDEEYLDKLIADEEYIFVGATGGAGGKNYVKHVCEKAKGTNAKLHLLAFVQTDFLKYYKPYSTDSSSWSSAFRFGSLGVYAGNGKIKTYGREDFAKRPKESLIRDLKNIGLTWDEIKLLGKEGSWQYVDMWHWSGMVTIMSHIVRSVRMEEKMGTKIYIALPAACFIEMVFKAYKMLRSRGVI